MDFANLDEETRRLMLEEIKLDLARGSLWLSPSLSERGRGRWPELLRGAAAGGTSVDLASALSSGDLVDRREVGTDRAQDSEPDDLAEGQFNRFYARAVCRRAIVADVDDVETYQARAVAAAPAGSPTCLDARVEATELLRALRSRPAFDVALGLRLGPASGMSVRLTS